MLLHATACSSSSEAAAPPQAAAAAADTAQVDVGAPEPKRQKTEPGAPQVSRAELGGTLLLLAIAYCEAEVGRPTCCCWL